MDLAIVSATAGVLGSVVGSSATIGAAWISQRTQGAREVIRAEVAKREALYGEFITECTKLLFDALVHTLEKPETLLPAYALLNRVRLCASGPVLSEAENLLRLLTEQYFSPNLSLQELELRALNRSARVDPLKPFGEACRTELKSMRARV